MTDSFERDLLERLTLGPLSIDAIADVLGLGECEVSENARLQRIYEWSRGNPLFALHLLSATPADLAAASPKVGAPEVLDRLVRSRLASVSLDARGLLLSAALDTRPSVTTLMAASTNPATARAALEEAERVGLISVAEGEVSFSHPLIRAVTVGEADPLERRKAHLRLAEVTRTPDERARHLALGSGGPDEAIASEVEAAAATAVARGGSDVAAILSTLRRPHAGCHSGISTSPDGIGGGLLVLVGRSLPGVHSARGGGCRPGAESGPGRTPEEAGG